MYSIRKILFLDFDGVLHPHGACPFSRLPLLEQYLLKMTEIEIVVSSSWRQDQSLEQLRNYFPVSLRKKVFDTTPTLDNVHNPGGRQREIEAYLASAGLNSTNTSWVALDDMPFLFDDGCPFLITVDPNKGFTDIDGLSLAAWFGIVGLNPIINQAT
jgi:hypothetical protein